MEAHGWDRVSKDSLVLLMLYPHYKTLVAVAGALSLCSRMKTSYIFILWL